MKDIFYVGVDDHEIELFEGQYPVENGMSYNSYLIKDEKIAVMDSVDKNFSQEWLSNVDKVLEGKLPDYLIVSHMEPDHSGSLIEFTKKYPNAILVATDKAFKFLIQFYGDVKNEKIVVKEGDTLSLGKHTLKFITAPMVHWPEVMFTYDEYENVLFSADAFGKFGALDYDDPEGWACEARRYYFGIVGKYGNQVQTVLKKLQGVKLTAICPLHGPILDDNLDYYLSTYDTWSKYESESKGVFIPVASVYGNTMEAAQVLAEKLTSKGVKAVVCDLNTDSMTEAFEDAFRYDRIVFASVTYNGTIFPSMNYFIDGLVERGYQNKKVAFIENGTWAAMAGKVMQEKLTKCKNLELLEPVVKLVSKLDESSLKQIEELADKLV
ncbi:MAG: FprA family A-type flavoprotein [Acholeplasmatales bacterium]|nr:FprA family A-type flavoprotein [Acholeplasmatales bacterium]